MGKLWTRRSLAKAFQTTLSVVPSSPPSPAGGRLQRGGVSSGFGRGGRGKGKVTQTWSSSAWGQGSVFQRGFLGGPRVRSLTLWVSGSDSHRGLLARTSLAFSCGGKVQGWRGSEPPPDVRSMTLDRPFLSLCLSLLI